MTCNLRHLMTPHHPVSHRADLLCRCLKLQVIFRKRATNLRALLRKMTYKDKESLDAVSHRADVRCEMMGGVESYTCICTYSFLYVSIIQTYVSHLTSQTYISHPIGCLKLQVIFRKRATNHRALLRKSAVPLAFRVSVLSQLLCLWDISCQSHVSCESQNRTSQNRTSQNRTSHVSGESLIGCLKLQVIFRKRATNHRALLLKISLLSDDFESSLWSQYQNID